MKRTAPPAEEAQRVVTFERLLADALARRPGAGRDEALNALAERYAEFRRPRLKAERKVVPPSLSPPP